MAGTVAILTFHTLDNRPSVISFAPALFHRAMGWLAARGSRCLPLLEAAEGLRQASPVEPRPFALTFDDGYESVYREGFPVLQRYGLAGTVFLAVGPKSPTGPDSRLPSLDGRSMLSWRQIREMHRWGVEFGAHTLTHADLTRLAPRRMKAEVYGSKAVIEDALGARVSCFAYPFGRCDRPSLDLVRRHFACACTDTLGLASGGSDPHALERVDAFYLRHPAFFRLILTRSFPWFIRAVSIPRRVRRRLERR